MKRLLLTAAAFAVFATTTDAQTPAGPEFRVNTNTTGAQLEPRVAVTHDGFMVTWSSRPGAASDYDVFAQAFDRRGGPVGAEFRVNSYTPGPTRYPDIAALPGGRFVVAWQSAGVDGSSYGVAARIFAGSGTPLTGEIVVNTYTTGYQQWPSIASDGAGNFVVVWNSFGQDGDGSGVFGQRFDATGARLGGEFQVTTTTAGPQQASPGHAVAMGADGGFVAVWDLGPNVGHILAQRFAPDGSPLGAELQVDVGSGFHVYPAVDGSADGGFVVVWTLPGLAGGLKARRHAPDGTPLGSQFQVNTSSSGTGIGISGMACDDQGNTAFVWALPGSPPFRRSALRRFFADGTPRGPETLAASGFTFAPAIESDAVGNLVAAWDTENSADIWGRRFGWLTPRALAVDTAGNAVLEPGDTASVRPSWRNDSGAALAFGGALSDISGPAGATYTLTDATADYGTVADASDGTCADCYGVSVSAPPVRPATHWDATVTEAITPDALGQMKRWTLHVGDSFGDVPRSSGFYRFVETLLHHGVTAGCTATTYCPVGSTMREQMAVFVLLAKEGRAYAPPACGTPVFGDVPASSPFCPWIEELARRGVVAGCGGGNFCPSDAVTREQMAVYVLRTLDPALSPPACATPMFADLPAASPFCRWVEELARRGIVSGCGGGDYCPAAAVSREQMGVFIVATFGLTLYGP